MKILAFETSAKAASVALLEEGKLLGSVYQNTGLTHSQTLMVMAQDLLSQLSLTPADVDILAVAAGPGSFTGVRIGVAAAKGFAWGREIRCCAVSTLAAMAAGLGVWQGYVCPVMDARRSQVYNALFLAAGEGLQRLAPDRAIGLDQLGEELKKVEKEKIVVGDGARLCYNTLTEQGITLKMAPEHLRMQSAWGVARAALELVRSGGLVSGEELAPVYCRLSQAERERLEREAKSK